MKKRFQLLVLSVLCAVFAHAQYVAPSEGVFRIVNVAYNAALMEDFVNHTLHCTATIGDNDDYEQLWILKIHENGYSLQNVFTGAYVQTGNSGTEVNYWTDATPKTFKIEAAEKENAYSIWDTGLNAGQGLHSKGANGNVVRWVACDASSWRFVKVDLSDADIAAARAEFERLTGGDKLESYQAVLNEVFEDAACTVLNAKYAAMSAEEIEAALVDKLPEALVAMAVKVKSGDWSEDNEKSNKPGWSSDYAKKFRVQLVEPHSIAGEITDWFGHNAHTNMDNPTGVYANKREVLYVMVEGEVKEGAELWATWLVGHTKMPNYNNGYSNGMRLKQGLNLIPLGSDGSALYINYLVHTFDKQRYTFPHKLSEYNDLKVHVEGGYINSYYNAHGDALYTADTDADWVYYEERANLHNITVVGRHQILQFELNDVTITEEKDGKTNTWVERGLSRLFPDELPTSLPENQRINAIVEAWDRISLSEKITLGEVSKAVVDSMNALYPRYDAEWKEKAEMYDYEGYDEFCKGRNYGDYYNNRGLAFGTVTGYMYGSWDHCGYHINTTPSILTQIATEAGPTWGPAHEIGHQHQGLFTVNGLTEVTNNLFSNIAVWYMGMGTSRVNGTEGNLAHAYDTFKAGGDFFDNNIWVLTQMYYRLWLYYHRAGNNTQFYPRLFELLRNNRLSGGYYQQGKTSILRFYQHCCDAAQEDLTEFFRAYGFFSVMNNRLVGDYSNSEYTQSQADIDAAIATIKKKGYPVNTKPLFINDCTPNATYSHDGKTQRSYWDGNSTTSGQNGEIGIYVDFLAKDTISGKYLYTLNDLNLSIAGGDGAVGFAIYNKENEIVAFSNHHKFTITEEVSTQLRSGNATLFAVTAAGDDVKIMSKAEGGSETEQYNALRSKLAEAKPYLSKIDGTGKKIGWLIPEYTGDLKKCVAEVDAVVANEDQSVHTYGEWYTMLDTTLTSLLTNVDARVAISDNCFYSIAASNDDALVMEYTSAGLKTSMLNGFDFTSQWKFIPAEAAGTYYIQHRTSGNYISAAKKGVRVKASATNIGEALTFVFVPGEVGECLIQRADDNTINLYSSKESGKTKQILAGTYTSNGSTGSACWAITLMDGMNKLPVASNDSERVTYYIENVETGNNLGQYLAGRNAGRVSEGTPESMEDNNYLFYFRAGSAKGKYTIYNCATEKSVTIDSKNYLMVNKDTEAPVEYTITATEDGKSFVISAEAGNWYTNTHTTINEALKSTYRFQQVGCPTEIEDIVVNKPVNCDIYFDLTGRRVDNPTSGIYIHNGKKVLVK